MEEIEKKSEEILDKEIFNSSNSLSDEEVSAFEDEYNIKLPKEYKFFLMNYMEGYINYDYRFPIIEKSVITPVDGFCSIDFLYVGNFIKEAKKYIFNYGRENLPIGVSVSGDLLCMGMQEERYGKIYYWYHEDESEGKGYYFVAESFGKFILSFEKKPMELSNIDDIEIELDDAILD